MPATYVAWSTTEPPAPPAEQEQDPAAARPAGPREDREQSPEPVINAAPPQPTGRPQRATRRPKRFNDYLSWDEVDQALYNAARTATTKEVFEDRNWREAMKYKFTSLRSNGVWELVNDPHNGRQDGEMALHSRAQCSW